MNTNVTPQPAKPVKLQVNTTGAWRDVVTFDAGNDSQTNQVMDGAADLGKAAAAKFRIVTTGSHPDALMHFTPLHGWQRAVAP